MTQFQKVTIRTSTAPSQSNLSQGLTSSYLASIQAASKSTTHTSPMIHANQSAPIRSSTESLALSTTAVVGEHQSLKEALTEKLNEISLFDDRRHEPSATFIHTNESQIQETQTALYNWAQTHKNRPVIQLGVGSIVNYSFALTSKPKVIVIADIDARLINFHRDLLHDISQLDKFDQSVAEQITRRLETESFGPKSRFKSRDTFDTSWIVPRNLERLAHMYKKGRIILSVCNINDALDAVEEAKNESRGQGRRKPKVAVYTSNVGDWICGRNTTTKDAAQLERNYAEFNKKVSNVVGSHGILIYSTVDKVSRVTGSYKQQVSQGCNGLPAFSAKSKNRQH